MTTCKIQWVTERGQLTPDDNPAVAVVRYTPPDRVVDGRKVDPEPRDYPICQQHLDRMLRKQAAGTYREWTIKEKDRP